MFYVALFSCIFLEASQTSERLIFLRNTQNTLKKKHEYIKLNRSDPIKYKVGEVLLGVGRGVGKGAEVDRGAEVGSSAEIGSGCCGGQRWRGGQRC